MEDRQFATLVKTLAQTRLSHLAVLHGLAASALAGLVGVAFPEQVQQELGAAVDYIMVPAQVIASLTRWTASGAGYGKAETRRL